MSVKIVIYVFKQFRLETLFNCFSWVYLLNIAAKGEQKLLFRYEILSSWKVTSTKLCTASLISAWLISLKDDTHIPT